MAYERHDFTQDRLIEDMVLDMIDSLIDYDDEGLSDEDLSATRRLGPPQAPLFGGTTAEWLDDEIRF